MELDTFINIVDCYGSEPQRWPDSQRAEALELLSQSSEAQRIVHEAGLLDDRLEASVVNIDLASLEVRISAAVDKQPSRLVERFISWLVPDSNRPVSIWRPACAASLPLLFGVALGSSVSLGTTDSYTDEEVLMLMGLTPSEEVATESLP